MYFLILPSLLHSSILFNCFYTCIMNFSTYASQYSVCTITVCHWSKLDCLQNVVFHCTKVCIYVTVSGKTRHIAQAVQCVLLVSQVKKCLSRVFVIFISKNLSTNLCHHLRMVNVSYQGEISLHFDLPSLYGSRTRSPLLWVLIRILYLDTARFIKLLYVCSPV